MVPNFQVSFSVINITDIFFRRASRRESHFSVNFHFSSIIFLTINNLYFSAKQGFTYSRYSTYLPEHRDLFDKLPLRITVLAHPSRSSNLSVRWLKWINLNVGKTIFLNIVFLWPFLMTHPDDSLKVTTLENLSENESSKNTSDSWFLTLIRDFTIKNNFWVVQNCRNINLFEVHLNAQI